MPDGRAHSRVFLGGDGGNTALHLGAVRFGKTLDVKQLGARAAHAGKSIDAVGVAQNLKGFAHEEQGFLDGRVDPALGRGGHVDKKEGADVAFVPGQPDKEFLRGGESGLDIGKRFDEGVKIDFVPVFLSPDKAFLIAHHFELPFEPGQVASVFFQGVADKGARDRDNLLCGKRTPVFAEAGAAVVPFVIDGEVGSGKSLALLRGWSAPLRQRLASRLSGA